MDEVIKKYESIRAISNHELATDMAKAVTESNQFALEQMFAMSNVSGDILTCANDDQTVILEMVIGQIGADSAVTIYEPHPVFGSPGTLMKARDEVIEAIRKIRPDAQMLRDPVRNRPALLMELGLLQLLDVLRVIKHGDAAIALTGENHV